MHRWQRDYNRSARMPPDFIEGARDTLIAWLLLLFFFMMVGLVCTLLGIGDD